MGFRGCAKLVHPCHDQPLAGMSDGDGHRRTLRLAMHLPDEPGETGDEVVLSINALADFV